MRRVTRKGILCYGVVSPRNPLRTTISDAQHRGLAHRSAATQAARERRTMPHENFIGGKWVPAKSGATDKVREPGDRRGARRGAGERRGRRRGRGRGRGGAFEEWSNTTPRQRFEALAKIADAIEADMETIRDLEMRNVGKPLSIIDFEMDLTVDNWRFFGAGARFLEGRGRRRVHGGAHVVPAPRPARCRGVDRAVELPAQHGDVEARSRARRRQHGRAEAVGAHAAHRAAPRGDHGRHPPARRAQRRVRARARPRARRS